MDIKIFDSLETAIADIYEEGVTIRSQTPVHGGDINDAYALVLSNGERVFLKVNGPNMLDMFCAEAVGLTALSSQDYVRVPKAYAAGSDKGRHITFLLMEYVESAPRKKTYWEDFGHAFARMHLLDSTRFAGGKRYGFLRDNYIGSTPQKNNSKQSWVDFYREERLLPQFEMARSYLGGALWDKAMRLLDKLDDLLDDDVHPSLLHGDLWGGNVHTGSDGAAWIIDPASYVGHFEADLAMTQMFGGFAGEFYDAYNEVNPIPTEYKERRRIYDLYQYTNHLNLFGGGYLGSVRSIIESF